MLLRYSTKFSEPMSGCFLRISPQGLSARSRTSASSLPLFLFLYAFFQLSILLDTCALGLCLRYASSYQLTYALPIPMSTDALLRAKNTGSGERLRRRQKRGSQPQRLFTSAKGHNSSTWPEDGNYGLLSHSANSSGARAKGPAFGRLAEPATCTCPSQ